jgi:hypothetical protein
MAFSLESAFMSSAFRSLSPRALVQSWSGAIRRFPVPLGLATILAIVLIGAIHEAWPDSMDDTLPGLAVGLGCALLASLGVSLRGEILGWSGLRNAALGLAAGVAMVTLGVIHEERDLDFVLTFLPLAVFLLTVAAVLARAPGRDDLRGWWEAFGDLTGCLFGLTVAVILGAGVSLWFFALELLLGAVVPGELIGDFWVVCLILVWPLTTLSRLRGGAGHEGDSEELTSETAMPNWLAIVVAGPLTLLACGYLVVLVLYLARLALEGKTDGDVALISALYLSYGVGVHLLTYPMRDDGPDLSRFYYKWFPRTLPLPLAALIWALALRVSDYGWTEPRYMVAAVALWLTVFCVYHLLRHRWAAPVLGPLVLGGLLLLGTFGPWGARSVAELSQFHRLEALITGAADVTWLAGDPSLEKLTGERAEEVSGLISWFEDRDEGDRIAPLFPGDRSELVADLNERRWKTEEGVRKMDWSFTVNPAGVQTVDGPGRIMLIDLWSGESATAVLEDGEVELSLRTKTITVRPVTGAAASATTEGEPEPALSPEEDGEPATEATEEDGQSTRSQPRLTIDLNPWLDGLMAEQSGTRSPDRLTFQADGFTLTVFELGIWNDGDNYPNRLRAILRLPDRLP